MQGFVYFILFIINPSPVLNKQTISENCCNRKSNLYLVTELLFRILYQI